MPPHLLHPQLLPATIGAVLGLGVIVWAGLWLARRWRGLRPGGRWGLAAVAAAFGAVYTLNLYAWFVEPSLLVVRRVEIASPAWSGPPLTIAALSDTHVGGPHVDAARMRRIVARVNGLSPDLVVLLGDYANGHLPRAARSPAENAEIEAGIAAFSALRAPQGVVAVIGNHDAWYDGQAVRAALEKAGATVLSNSHTIIARPGARPLVIAGLADADTGQPNLLAAVDGAPPASDLIVLSHSPDPFADLPPWPALMLAGHSHCGQVTLPLIGRPILPIRHKAYACGLIREGGKALYVTAGIGESILPLRLGNPPEIVLVTIRAAA